jgi:hypothetical protein
MTNQEILQLAKSCGFDDFAGTKDDGTGEVYYECWEDQLLTFAKKIYEKGRIQ